MEDEIGIAGHPGEYAMMGKEWERIDEVHSGWKRVFPEEESPSVVDRWVALDSLMVEILSAYEKMSNGDRHILRFGICHQDITSIEEKYKWDKIWIRYGIVSFSDTNVVFNEALKYLRQDPSILIFNLVLEEMP